MFITKFNRMVRNKLIWGGFAFIVVISFVWYFTPSTSQSRQDAERAASAGKLSGESVSREDFRTARLNTYISVVMQLGRQLPITPELDEILRKETWQRLATIQQAQALGLAVTDHEVLTAIQRTPMFQADGQFRTERYDAFCQGFLAKMGLGPQQFEAYVREQILVQKMQEMVVPAVWVPPTQILDLLRKYTDTFTVEHITVDQDEAGRDVQASRDDAERFYEAHTNQFIVPDRVRVRYVSFPASTFLTNIEITAAAVTNYYFDHVQEYTTYDTNGTATVTDLAEVEDDIEDALTIEVALSRARDEAVLFFDRLVPAGRDEKAPSFEEAAAAASLVVHTSTLFSADEPPQALKVGEEFARAAFDLRNRSDSYFSDPISGKDAVYVLAYHEHIDSHLPSFREVEPAAVRLATQQTRREALARKSAEIRGELEKAVLAGKAFKAAAEGQGFKVVTPKPFTAYDAPDPFASAEAVEALAAHQQNELTDPIPVKGGMLIAFISERKPGDEAAIATLRPQMVMNLTRRYSRLLFQEWQESLVRSAGIEDHDAADRAADSEDEEQAEDE